MGIASLGLMNGPCVLPIPRRSVRILSRLGESSRRTQVIVSAIVCIPLLIQTSAANAAFKWLEKLGIEQQQQREEDVRPDPVEPFTIFGSISKKYSIEQIVNGKVVARRRGLTASACMNVLDTSVEISVETSGPQGSFPFELKDPYCGKGEGQSREESCSPPCRVVCRTVIGKHLTEVREKTGYILDPVDIDRVEGNCYKQCFEACLKPGKTMSFMLPFRPRK